MGELEFEPSTYRECLIWGLVCFSNHLGTELLLKSLKPSSSQLCFPANILVCHPAHRSWSPSFQLLSWLTSCGVCLHVLTAPWVQIHICSCWLLRTPFLESLSPSSHTQIHMYISNNSDRSWSQVLLRGSQLSPALVFIADSNTQLTGSTPDLYPATPSEGGTRWQHDSQFRWEFLDTPKREDDPHHVSLSLASALGLTL